MWPPQVNTCLFLPPFFFLQRVDFIDSKDKHNERTPGLCITRMHTINTNAYTHTKEKHAGKEQTHA